MLAASQRESMNGREGSEIERTHEPERKKAQGQEEIRPRLLGSEGRLWQVRSLSESEISLLTGLEQLISLDGYR